MMVVRPLSECRRFENTEIKIDGEPVVRCNFCVFDGPSHECDYDPTNGGFKSDRKRIRRRRGSK